MFIDVAFLDGVSEKDITRNITVDEADAAETFVTVRSTVP